MVSYQVIISDNMSSIVQAICKYTQEHPHCCHAVYYHAFLEQVLSIIYSSKSLLETLPFSAD